MTSSSIYKFFKSHSKMNFNKVLKSNFTKIKSHYFGCLFCSCLALCFFFLGFHYKIIFFCLILFKFFLLKKTEPACFNGFWKPPEEQHLCWWSVLSVVCRHSVPAAGDYINKFVTSWHQFVMEARKRKRKKEAENIIQNFGITSTHHCHYLKLLACS